MLDCLHIMDIYIYIICVCFVLLYALYFSTIESNMISHCTANSFPAKKSKDAQTYSVIVVFIYISRNIFCSFIELFFYAYSHQELNALHSPGFPGGT